MEKEIKIFKMEKEIKIYKVEFNTYSDMLDTTVYNESLDKYIDIPFGGLLIAEDELETYMQFGNGFKKIEFIGSKLKNI